MPFFQTHRSVAAQCSCGPSRSAMQMLQLCCTAATCLCRRVQAVDWACADRLLHCRCISIQRADRHQQPLPGVHRSVHRLRQAGGTSHACQHAVLLSLNPIAHSMEGSFSMWTPAPCCQACIVLPPARLEAELPLAGASPDAVGSTQHHRTAASCAVQVETTVSNSLLRITGSWIGSCIGFGIMSSAIATNPYGAPVSLPRCVRCSPCPSSDVRHGCHRIAACILTE